MGITKDGNGVIVYAPAKNESRNEMSGTVVDDEFAIVDQTNVLKQIQFKITPTDNNPGIATLNVNLGANTTIDLTGGGGGGGSSLAQAVWVDKSGNDGTGAVGDISKPFLTLAGAELAIADATDAKRYVVYIGAGDFDITGIAKKAHVSWAGAGSEATSLSGTGNFDLTSADMGVNFGSMGFSNLTVNPPIVCNTFATGGIVHSEFTFTDVIFNASLTFTGRGEDTLYLRTCRSYATPNTFTSFQVFAWSLFGNQSGADDWYFNTANGKGTNALIFDSYFGPKVHAAGPDFCLVGLINTAVFNLVDADGASTSLFVSPESSLAGVPVLTNGAALNRLGSAGMVSYIPGFSGNWGIVVPDNVRDGLDFAVRHPYGRYRGWISSASDVNVPLTGFAAGTPIDGVPIQDGDRVFFLNQTNPTENGIWGYDEGSQSFSIDPENPVGLRLRAADLFYVYSGDTHGASLWSLNHTFDIGSGSDQNSFDPAVTKTPTLKVANGATGTFTTTDLKTVTVTNGIITSIV